MKNKDLPKGEFFDLVALKLGSRGTSKGAELYYNAILQTILAELDLNSRIKLPIFGYFYLRDRGGFDKLMYNTKDGYCTLRAVKKKLGLSFKPSAQFLRAINEDFKLETTMRKPKRTAKNAIHKKRTEDIEPPSAKDIVFARKNKELMAEKLEELKNLELEMDLEGNED